MKKYFFNRSFCCGLILASVVFMLMIAGLFFMPCNPLENDVTNTLAGFSAAHFLGTDYLGRDVLSRLMLASRISIIIGFIVTLVSFVFGILLGALGGYFGGWLDAVVTKIIDVEMAFPGILLALMLTAVFGASIQVTVFALCIMGFPRFARIARSGFIKYKEATFVLASKARGASNIRIMARHILPNISGDLIVTATVSFAMAVLSESGLSYLGLGTQPPYPSFGNMLNDAQRYILANPEGVLIPALCVTMLVLGFNLIGDGINQVDRGQM